MEFTQADAKEKENRRQWVRTREHSVWGKSDISAGTWGRVLFAHPRGRRTFSITPEGWVVDICFYPSYTLAKNISKGQYERGLLEM